MPKFYLTTPIYYVNARPHMGHTYTTVVADTIARYKRMRGFDVVMLTGTDEHGQKVERSAKAAGKNPQEFADEISGEYRRLWQELDLKFDRFIRTTEDRHERAVHNLLLKARDNGYVYTGHYEGQYCVFDEMYVDEPLEGGLCPECKRPTERIREENYYFKLAEFEERLLKHYEKHPEFIQPETRRNEVMAFVKGGLRDLSISRSRTQLRWGIPFPEDDRHVIYVWYDALTSYMTGVGYGDDELQWEKYWPADLHLIGKEILRFHAVYWPAFLMAAEEPLPKQIVAHGWWLFEQEKMSKSRGNIKRPQPLARTLGIDALRYFLLREMVFGQDGNFSYDAVLQRYNADLANDLGNLAKRTLDMIARYFGGEVPSPGRSGDQTPRDLEVARAGQQSIETALAQYDRYEFSRALETIWGLVAEVNKYIVENEPWKLADDPEKRARLETVLYTSAEAVRVVAALTSPVMPHAAQSLWQQLGLGGDVGRVSLDDLAWGQLAMGTPIGTPEGVFPRVKKDEALERIEAIEEEIEREAAGRPAPVASTPGKEAKSNVITIEDFAKVEMKVGEVKAAEKVAGADKLLKIQVDVGEEVRQVVAGIAEVYKPEELIGRKVIVVTNLQPRKLRGVESNGMIVAASVAPEGKPVLATFTEPVPPGTKLK